MTKTLTEQWREGTLPFSRYYAKFVDGSIDNIALSSSISLYESEHIKEVLAPVPNYDEYKRLQEQIKEANELLKAYGTESLWESLSLSCDEANEYCKKWGVK